MGHCFDCLEQKDSVQNKKSRIGPQTFSPCNIFSGSMGRTGVFVATAITNFVAGGVSLSTPALAKHLQSTFNGTTAVQAGRLRYFSYNAFEKSTGNEIHLTWKSYISTKFSNSSLVTSK